MKPTYADPTAWAAIANVEKQQHKQAHTDHLSHNKGAESTRHIGVYHAPGAITLHVKATVFRPENTSLRYRTPGTLNNYRGIS